MISIDKLAYISKLKNVNPMEKFIFSMLTIIVCISLNNIADSIIILLIMGFITVYKGKITIEKLYWVNVHTFSFFNNGCYYNSGNCSNK